MITVNLSAFLGIKLKVYRKLIKVALITYNV
jgi:hypothetical protein